MSRSSWLPTAAALVVLAGCGATPSAEPSTSAASTSASPVASTASSAASTPSASPSASTEPSPGVSVPADATKIGGTLEYDDQVRVTISQIQNAGTTTTFTIEIDNRGPDEVTGPADVQVSYGNDNLAAAPVEGGTPLSVPVSPGKKTSGKYAFTIPVSDRGDVHVDIALGSDRDHAQYKGSVK